MQYYYPQQQCLFVPAYQQTYSILYPQSYPICYVVPSESIKEADQKHIPEEKNDSSPERMNIFKQDSEEIKLNQGQETQELIEEHEEPIKKPTKSTSDFDSTNLHKNLTKAIVAYAATQQFTIYKLLGEEKGQEFFELMQHLKNKLNNLTHIVKYTKNSEYLKAFRILGLVFLKKQYPSYIYNSKIQKKSSHLKHKVIIKKTLLRI